ncbi:MAG TPA: hypothetical protein VFH37_02735, partial [Candidatus Saccharimonadales bacterium]|nr:hypothetical protein [Candidatus Saccharimonadales bacterium]
MDDDKHKDQFSASLPLPGHGKKDEANPAADLIRKRIDAAYENEPSAREEVEEVEGLGVMAHRSKHQEFIYNLTNSGRPLHEIQTAWHEYYAGLTDSEKHKVWQEFYSTQAAEARHPVVTHQTAIPAATPQHLRHEHRKPQARANRKVEQAKQKIKNAPAAIKKPAKSSPLHSLLFGLGVGGIVIVVFLFSFFNDRIIAPFIQPSRNVQDIPIISTGTVGSDPLVIIPKINVEIPVVYDVSTINETAVETGLE